MIHVSLEDSALDPSIQAMWTAFAIAMSQLDTLSPTAVIVLILVGTFIYLYYVLLYPDVMKRARWVRQLDVHFHHVRHGSHQHYEHQRHLRQAHYLPWRQRLMHECRRSYASLRARVIHYWSLLQFMCTSEYWTYSELQRAVDDARWMEVNRWAVLMSVNECQSSATHQYIAQSNTPNNRSTRNSFDRDRMRSNRNSLNSILLENHGMQLRSRRSNRATVKSQRNSFEDPLRSRRSDRVSVISQRSSFEDHLRSRTSDRTFAKSQRSSFEDQQTSRKDRVSFENGVIDNGAEAGARRKLWSELFARNRSELFSLPAGAKDVLGGIPDEILAMRSSGDAIDLVSEMQRKSKEAWWMDKVLAGLGGGSLAELRGSAYSTDRRSHNISSSFDLLARVVYVNKTRPYVAPHIECDVTTDKEKALRRILVRLRQVTNIKQTIIMI